ncbi:hypothetical protein GQ53DRAFT_744098 [Thozetella sp. PMI_491]|nr:hypothetical protein GQ53DRAFT_744098 [Thozetella sp. PMI_491]
MKKRACDACRRRKIQCDLSADRQQCDWCRHHGLACTFTSPVIVRRRVAVAAAAKYEPSSHLGSKEARGSAAETPAAASPNCPTHNIGPIQRPHGLEQTNAAYQSSPPAGLSPPSRDAVAGVAYGQMHYAGYHIGEISSQYGLPVFSTEGRKFILSLTGQEPSLEDPNSPSPGWHQPPTAVVGHTEAINAPTKLPPREVTETAVSEFLSSITCRVFPFIDRVLFSETIAAAYDSQDDGVCRAPSIDRACVLAFMSIAQGFQEDMDLSPYRGDSDAYALEAHSLLNGCLDDLNLTALQTMMMLLMYFTFSGRFHSSAILHSMACRTAFVLGGHHCVMTEPFGQETTREGRQNRHLRILFWICYAFDKDMALRSGHPPTITDEYCDLTVPEGYADSRYRLESGPRTEPSDTSLPHFPTDLALSILKSKAYRALFSAEALKKSNAELLRDIRELDDELESWRLSIPVRFRPTLSVSHNRSSAEFTDKSESMQKVTLQLDYHYVLTAIHRVVGRHYVWHPLDQRDRASGIKSSLDLSVEAGRSTLFYLRAAVSGLARNAFWFLIFYLIAAVMTLFFNILTYPHDPQALADLDLLRSTRDLIRAMPIRRLSPRGVVNLGRVDRFVAEIIRLGDYAILRVREREKN